ncbi:DUF2070 family protein [Methanoplanus sp. FWC-SCC4]|uniref:DUF2070 family protein n=1 Tax=Methanochimaera problematica TaxID=2609417 RepID=A0AA97FB34_9EURY|nr:DUF2070 family protein [Methanoplanus sp. FWC-SCC4]WOF15627.1 DUF2070 family protein [Methanoplanus sp. FWC-SCC4]
MAPSGDTKIEGLSRFLFIAPSWPRSLAIIFVLGLVLDLASVIRNHEIQFFGFTGFFLPAIIAFILTKPLVEIFGKKITWNRSALLALACTVFSILISLFPVLLVFQGIFPLLFSVSLGFIFAIRLIVLVAIADYKMSHMILPALTQSVVGILIGTYYFSTVFTIFAVLIHLLFGMGVILFLWLIERPLKKNFHISALNFINAFIAHNTDGSKSLEDFFHEIGEEVYVPQFTLFFSREGRKDVLFTIPNLHPGPMGEIGGGNLPKVLYESLGGETFVAHGCATHDFNLVSEKEIPKIISAINKTRAGLEYHNKAGMSERHSYGSVQVLAQSFGDSILMVSTRSPEMTEDLEYPIGLSIMNEGHKKFSHVGFVDAHNCMVDVVNPVMPASLTAYEYMKTCDNACEKARINEQFPFKVGISHINVPFTREQGFGDIGIQALVTEVSGQKTAYILFDGNNMQNGVREILRNELLKIVDECELMTTDSHVVNTMSGKNPVGYHVSADIIMEYVVKAVSDAIKDLSDAKAGASTAWCEGVVVFGSHRISQLASSVNAMLTFIAPLGLAILLLAFVFSIIAYFILV